MADVSEKKLLDETAVTAGVEEVDGLEAVRFRNHFYRDSYRSVLVAFILSLLLNLALVSFAAFLRVSEQKQVYFALSNSGSLTPLIPLNEPYVDIPTLSQWVIEALVESLDYDFYNYRERLSNASNKYFTTDGRDQYLKALRDAGTLKIVQEKKLMVKGIVRGAPVIIPTKRRGGRFFWEIEVPLLIRYTSAAESISQPVIVKLVVVRVSTLDSDKGIAINQIVMDDDKVTAKY